MKKKLWLSAALLAGLPALGQAQWGITYVDTSHNASYVTAGADGNLYVVSSNLNTDGALLKLTLTWAGATVTSTGCSPCDAGVSSGSRDVWVGVAS